MVTIQIAEDFLAAHPEYASNFQVFLGNEEGGVFAVSNGATHGGYVVQVIAGSICAIENEIFQVLVNNSIGGSFPRFLNQLLQYVSKGVLEVKQDNTGDPLTRKEIMEYQAPEPPPTP